MAEREETKFANGLIVKDTGNAPSWVLGKLSINVDEFIETLNTHMRNGWVNIDICVSQTSGKKYGKIDTWEPRQQEDQPRAEAPRRPPPPPFPKRQEEPEEEDDLPGLCGGDDEEDSIDSIPF